MADYSNDKIIDDFKKFGPISRRSVHMFVKAMCIESQGAEVEAILLGHGFAPCVAREWGNEHRNRDKMLKRSIERKYRKETSAYGLRGQNYRSIIASSVSNGRRLEFHATKGPRDYQVTV